MFESTLKIEVITVCISEWERKEENEVIERYEACKWVGDKDSTKGGEWIRKDGRKQTTVLIMNDESDQHTFIHSFIYFLTTVTVSLFLFFTLLLPFFHLPHCSWPWCHVTWTTSTLFLVGHHSYVASQNQGE